MEEKTSQWGESIFRYDFAAFIGRCFHTLNPAQRYLHNWHIELIAEYLEACRRKEISRLIINMPPRALKSVCVSVAWPAWLLGHDPHNRIMAASYAQSLSEKHSVDCRMVMQTPWYRRLFPDTQLSRVQNEKQKFMTTAQGMRMATSVLGTATGEGGDILIADDIISAQQAMRSTMRRATNEWFEHTFSTRLNHKKSGCIVLVMQRLHAEDVSGYLLAKGGWEHLCLPAFADTPQRWFVGGREWVRDANTLLHPAREDETLIRQAKRELGSVHFAAQYQQEPLPQEGGMIELSWFVRYDG